MNFGKSWGGIWISSNGHILIIIIIKYIDDNKKIEKYYLKVNIL